MTKELLKYLMQLFALVANAYPQVLLKNVKDFITTFILKEYETEVIDENLRLLDNYYKNYSEALALTVGENDYRTIIEFLLTDIDFKISGKHKFLIIIRLLLFERFLLKYAPVHDSKKIGIDEIIDILTQIFQVKQSELISCRGFIDQKLYNIPNLNCLLILSKNKLFNSLPINYIEHKDLNGQLFFLYVESINKILFYYQGNQSISLNHAAVYSNQIYLFNKGYIIHGTNIEPIYYNQILRIFLTKTNLKLILSINNVSFKFKNSNNGIQSISAQVETGQLVGIMGRSGVGKSTLLNILNGQLTPNQGTVLINNISVFSNSYKLDGIIGYIPQDDLLIEELSVYTNLFINSQLCFAHLTSHELNTKVNALLTELNLFDVKDLKVGNPLNKFISGGQRKKLNMALELIRNPWILFVDEPTSGLSSSDSDEIMQLLSDQTLTGRIVVVNIHQPSSETFKMLDKIIIIDKEGYPVYCGNPLEAISWFNKFAQRNTLVSDYCYVCETVNPESIFKALEEKNVDEFGEITQQRKVTPQQWHNYFNTNNKINTNFITNALPPTSLKRPNVFKQFVIFGKRNLLTKIANSQYVILASLISPVLALLLAFLCKSGSDINENYIFAFNDNLPSYFFMSVIVALFVGMIVSAEEIIKDRKILYRESFLKLSIVSYIHTKIVYLIILSALQTFLYTLIGNYILGITGITAYFWLILLLTSVIANLIGLIISGIFNSVIVIYIMVPLIMIPQIILSGVVVNFKKLNKYVANQHVTPLVGDAVISRWAHEALAVYQFKNNNYQKYYFDIDKQISNYKFDLIFVIPEIQRHIKDLISGTPQKTDINKANFLVHETFKLCAKYPTNYINSLNNNKLTKQQVKQIDKYITQLNFYLQQQYEKTSGKKEIIKRKLIAITGNTTNYNKLINNNSNNSINELMLNRKTLKPYLISNNKIIREIEPVYQNPDSKIGRAHFYASQKQIGNFEISTSVFNAIVLLIIAFTLYGVLVGFSYLFIRNGKN